MAAAYCCCSERTIERAVRRGHLKFHRLGTSNRYRFRREWLDAWLAGKPADTESGTLHAEQAETTGFRFRPFRNVRLL